MPPPTPSLLDLSGRRVGPGQPCLLIGEVAQSHDGSLGQAHAFIDLLAGCGFDAVKFQTHMAAAESTLDEPFRVKFSRQDDTRYAYWRRMEFTEDQWAGLAQHAREKGLLFLSSPFSVEAVRLLERVGVPAWKIGSGEFRSDDLLDAMGATGKPVLVSSGMSTHAEVDACVARFIRAGVPVGLFQCTSEYPVPLEHVGLNVIDEYRARHACPVGLSDHSGSVFPALMAMARGADMIEVHAAFHRGMFGPDVPSSLVPDELTQLARARDAFHAMATHPGDKDELAEGKMAQMRALFTKSLAPAAALPRGTVLAPGMLVPRKPGTGFPASAAPNLIGRRLARDVTPDRLLRPEDLEP